MSSVPDRRYTVEEYLAFERASETKHEYFDGQIVPLYRDAVGIAGTSLSHTIIVRNLVQELSNRLEQSGCLVLPQDIRIKASTRLYTSPDVAIVCDEPLLEDDRQDILLNPLIVIEVLSPSTEAYDRGKKFELYSAIATLKEYVLVAQDHVSISHFVRQTDSDDWLCNFPGDLNPSLDFKHVDCSVPLSRIYRQVIFPTRAFGAFTIADEEDSAP